MGLLVHLISFLIINQCFCEETIEINLNQGTLVGKVEKTLFKKQNYYTFKGIPFADKPTGKLRFQPPEPHQGWDGTLEAFEHKPTCMQFSSRMRLRAPFGISGSEDCLYISVFTPDIKGKAPVMVFEYNDYFSTWFNGTDYSPDFLIEEGVVVVTISHRLGILGYLTTEDNVIPGNNGLRDYILGLEWVKKNVEKFGGDATKVTLMGSESGATLANILLYSKKATGLFSGVILQSGTALELTYFPDNPKSKALELGRTLNITFSNSEELLLGLQEIDAETLLRNEINVLVKDDFEKQQRTTRPFTPTIEHNAEDAIINKLPENSEIINDVPIIIGFNSREGLDLISQLIFEPKLLSTSVEDTLFQFPIRSNFRFDIKSAKYKEANREIVEFYYKDKSIHYGNILEHSVYIQDVAQNYAIDLAALTFANNLKSPVFYYIFDYRGEWNINSQYLMTRSRSSIEHHGATVLDELCYLLVCTPLMRSYEQFLKMPSEQREVKTMKRMVRMWSNFAKTGNPTPSKEDEVLKGFTWEPFNIEADNYLLINKQLKMKTKPLSDHRKFWNDFLEKYSKLAVDGVVADDKSQEQRDDVINREVDISNDETVSDEDQDTIVTDEVDEEPLSKDETIKVEVRDEL